MRKILIASIEGSRSRSCADRRVMKAAFSIVCSMVLCVAPAFSSPVHMAFQGTVQTVDSLLSSSFSVGDTLRGTYTFESATIGVPAYFNPYVTVYSAVTDIRLSIRDYEGTFAQTVDDEIRIHDQPSGGGLDRFELLHSFAGPSIGVVAPNHFSLLLDDSTASVFQGAELPLDLPSISDFSSTDWYIQFCPLRGRCHSSSRQFPNIKCSS